MRTFVLLCVVLPIIGGCSLIDPNPIPPAPARVGVAAANADLADEIERTPDGASFTPLVDARRAVKAAKAQAQVKAYDADSLTHAESALADAENAWQKLADKRRRPSAELAKVADAAHRAQRLAEVAKYTAVREINLDKLLAANKRLERRRDGASSAAVAGGGASAAVGGDLLNERVVPDRLGAISFKPGTARMKPAAKKIAAQLAGLLRANPDYGVAILGHTDNAAPADASLQRFVKANPELKKKSPSPAQKVKAFNLALSSARARAVARTLVSSGIDPKRIGARGFGDRQPVASNDTTAGRRANRRIEAIIVPGPGSPSAAQGDGSRLTPQR